jgi:hypothetical protein
MTLFSTGNFAINTTTDAGFKLDVNGTARVQGLTTLRTTGSSYNSVLFVENTGTAGVDNANVAIFMGNRGSSSSIDDNTNVGIWQKSNIVNNYAKLSFFNSGGNTSAYIGTQFLNHGAGQSANLFFGTAASGAIVPKMTLFSSGNLAINTTTDAGFRLDVNGTARVQDNTTITKTQDGITSISLLNGSTGANASARFYLGSTATQLAKLSSGYTSGSILKSGDFFMYNQTVGNITFWNNLSTGNINFTTGSASSPQMTLKPSGVLNLSSVPTSSAGLSAGDIWNDGGTLKIV